MKQFVFITFIIYLLTGCIEVNTPSLANQYNDYLYFEVYYQDGKTNIGKVGPNSCTFIGQKGYTESMIEKINFSLKNKFKISIDEQNIKNLEIKKKIMKGYDFAWIVDKDGVDVIANCVEKIIYKKE